ncbi:hypothetical protein J4G63_06035 [Aeromonas sobria]|nr:hypothetical protein [Aeromonas sobria]
MSLLVSDDGEVIFTVHTSPEISVANMCYHMQEKVLSNGVTLKYPRLYGEISGSLEPFIKNES